MASLEESIRFNSLALGFCLTGIAPAAESDGFDRLVEWLQRGFAGEMEYMARHGEARRHPNSILPEVRSVIMVAMEYLSESSAPAVNEAPAQTVVGKIARYASGPDYHDIIKEKLRRLLRWLQTEVSSCRGRAVVDTAPLLERDFARRAGLGWIGKNTMLINKHRGSYLLLGALLTNLELSPDEPHHMSHCGTCTACLDACPTEAFTGPGWLDSRRCISYLTIEKRGVVPEELRPGIDDWLFGCDVCQEVCPWNRRSHSEPERLDAFEVLMMDEAAFRARFRDTAIWRTRRSGLRRNAAIVLGNVGDAAKIEALRKFEHDADPSVRDAIQYAIHQILIRSPSE
jgi:epoxyqueuosine reductase